DEFFTRIAAVGADRHHHIFGPDDRDLVGHTDQHPVDGRTALARKDHTTVEPRSHYLSVAGRFADVVTFGDGVADNIHQRFGGYGSCYLHLLDIRRLARETAHAEDIVLAAALELVLLNGVAPGVGVEF